MVRTNFTIIETPRLCLRRFTELDLPAFIAFALYASAKRWRSGWSPSIRLPQSLLPISARQLIALIQDRYPMQIEAYRIENVEVADTFSLSHKRKKV